MAERRFTDSDVAVILTRAAELDATTDGGSSPRGLSEGELREIAVEVGIDPDMVGRAVAEFGRGRAPSSAKLLGPPPSHREIRAVPGRLSQESIADLVRVVDERIPAQGTIGEALGAVRWTAGDRRLSRQVTFEPSDDETVIRVEERYGSHIRGLLHGLPTFYAGFLGMIVGLEQVGGAVPAALIGGSAAAAAFLAGRAVWTSIARRSRSRVAELADTLSEEAGRLASNGE